MLCDWASIFFIIRSYSYAPSQITFALRKIISKNPYLDFLLLAVLFKHRLWLHTKKNIHILDVLFPFHSTTQD